METTFSKTEKVLWKKYTLAGDGGRGLYPIFWIFWEGLKVKGDDGK